MPLVLRSIQQSNVSLEQFESGWLIPQIQEYNSNEFNLVISAVGDPGVGKSRLLELIGQRLLEDQDWTVREIAERIASKGFIYFGLDEFYVDKDNLEEGNPMIFDEAGVSHDAHFWRDADSQDFKQLTEMWRFKKWNCFYAMPDFSFLLKSQRLLTDGLMVVKHRGYCEVQGVVRDHMGGMYNRISDSLGEARILTDWPMPDPLVDAAYDVRKKENFRRRMAIAEAKNRIRKMMNESDDAAVIDRVGGPEEFAKILARYVK
jgi:DnaJ-domain-containing protein 1